MPGFTEGALDDATLDLRNDLTEFTKMCYVFRRSVYS